MDVKLQTQSQKLKSTNSGEPGAADEDNWTGWECQKKDSTIGWLFESTWFAWFSCTSTWCRSMLMCTKRELDKRRARNWKRMASSKWNKDEDRTLHGFRARALDVEVCWCVWNGKWTWSYRRRARSWKRMALRKWNKDEDRTLRMSTWCQSMLMCTEREMDVKLQSQSQKLKAYGCWFAWSYKRRARNRKRMTSSKWKKDEDRTLKENPREEILAIPIEYNTARRTD